VWGGGGSFLLFQWTLLPPRPFSSVNGCSPQFLPTMSWRDDQSSWVFKMGESSKGDDPGGGVVGYPWAVQVAKSCYHTMGVSYGGLSRVFWIS
jgi:hypothetical protein